MHRYTICVFEDIIMLNVSNITSAEWNEKLGAADQLALQVTVDDFKGGTSPMLQVTLQHSADGRNWVNKSTLINSSIVTSSTSVMYAFDDGSAPSFRFVRFALRLTASGASSANVKVLVTARDEGGIWTPPRSDGGSLVGHVTPPRLS